MHTPCAALSQSGETIISRGEQADGMYLVQSGTARAEDSAGGLLKVYRSGDFFGELALSSAEPRKATVRATSFTVTVLKLPHLAFERICK